MGRALLLSRSTVLKNQYRIVAAALVTGVAFLALYSHVIARLIHDWATDENYSHGFFIVPIALYLAWERRDALSQASWRGSMWGLLPFVGGLALLVAGTLGAEFFLTRISMVVVLAGVVVLLGGREAFRVLLFPIGFLLLMIPIPAIVFNQIAFPLQLLASRFGTTVMGLVGVPVLREGNVLVLANITLEVAEACSGIRSLVSLLAIGMLIGYFGDRRAWARSVLTLMTVPVAIFTNGLRVAGTGIAAYYYGPKVAEGILHMFSGWMIFTGALGVLFLIQRGLLKIGNRATPAPIFLAPRRAA